MILYLVKTLSEDKNLFIILYFEKEKLFLLYYLLKNNK